MLKHCQNKNHDLFLTLCNFSVLFKDDFYYKKVIFMGLHKVYDCFNQFIGLYCDPDNRPKF